MPRSGMEVKMTIEEAGKLFKAHGCSRFAMFRDPMPDVEKYSQLNISEKQEDIWRFEEATRIRKEKLDNIQNISNSEHSAVIDYTWLIKEIDNQKVKEESLDYLMMLTEKYLNSERITLILDMIVRIKSIAEKVKDKVIRQNIKNNMLRILEGLKNRKFVPCLDDKSFILETTEHEFKEHLYKTIENYKKL